MELWKHPNYWCKTGRGVVNLAHLGTFLQHLRYYLEQIPMLGRYQVLTNSIWTAIAIYILIIIVGMVCLRYQPKVIENKIDRRGDAHIAPLILKP